MKAQRAIVAGAALAAILAAAWVWLGGDYQPLSETEVSEALVNPLPVPGPPPPPPADRPVVD